ncbi:IspD/TarI family cytidylyltransferase [Aquipuribacter hungaricus]|uniref:2-C-methyl-D-erythritol 4-phosphate cytidylyltransferase n=1 Tax=Aquipuribacter hungaricus TaxID=545624 RepID=A0ABV7WCD7_9MICO
MLVAGGSGTRLGLGVPKALAVAGRSTLLELAVAAVAAVDPATGSRAVGTLVVVVPAAEQDACTAMVRQAWSAAGAPGDPVVVPGGADRQASVAAGLDALAEDVDVVLVHDAARALAPPSVFTAVAAAVAGDVVAVVPGLTPADTVKQLAPATGGPRTVAGTLDRSSLVAVQTPQGFRADVLRALHAADRTAAVTDDAGMAEAAGHPVVVVPGHTEAFKVTTAVDLLLARALLENRSAGQDGARDR